MTIKNIAIITLGCSKNEIDSELMVELMKKDNFSITDSLEKADIIVINTCGFIREAKEESIEVIWEAIKYKERGKCKFIILAGCLAERYSDELLGEIDAIDGIIGTGNIKDIVSMIIGLQKGNKRLKKVKNINEGYLEGVKRSNFAPSKYIKISEGCNNFCTYCIIPKLRGKHRSRRMEDIVGEVEFFVKNGVKEIILIGQNITDYGIDIYGEYRLYKLLDALNKIDELKWIRLLYLYPDNITQELIRSIRDNDKVLKYLDIPLQHINDDILNKMNRKTSKKDIIRLISTLRKEIPDIVLRTTFIVGFPGETEEHFRELYNFVEEIQFDRLGVFTYSKEEDTPAYGFDGQLDEKTKQHRKKQLMELQRNISYTLNSLKVGRIYEAIVEEKVEKGLFSGRTYMDSPDIDGGVFIKSDKDLEYGEFVNVRITDAFEYDLMGEIMNELG